MAAAVTGAEPVPVSAASAAALKGRAALASNAVKITLFTVYAPQQMIGNFWVIGLIKRDASKTKYCVELF
jgi:hypothetical protein